VFTISHNSPLSLASWIYSMASLLLWGTLQHLSEAKPTSSKMACMFHVFLQNPFSWVSHLQHILSPPPHPHPFLQCVRCVIQVVIWLKPKTKTITPHCRHVFILLATRITWEKFHSDAHVYNRTSYEDPVLSLSLLLHYKFVFQPCCCCQLWKTESWKQTTHTTSWSHKASLFFWERKVS